MTTTKTPGGIQINLDVPSAKELRDVIERKERERAAEALKQQQASEAEKKHQEEVFLAEKLGPDFVNQIIDAVYQGRRKKAAHRELELIGQFPSDWCTDRGRKKSMQPRMIGLTHFKALQESSTSSGSMT